MDKLPVGQLPDLQQSNNDDEIMVITNSEYNQLKKEKISDLITDFTSKDENNALTKGTDGKMFVTDFGNASNITEGTLPVSVLPDIPKDLLPAIETSDLPLSGVTADTYAYPSSVTVNAQGQVTAIEEGTPSGANADTDLSNLTAEGEKHFLNKTQLTNCILEAPNGVVEWSGVTPTGSLVNNQGVVSGFSTSNYLMINKIPNVVNSFEMEFCATTGSNVEGFQCITGNYLDQNFTCPQLQISDTDYLSFICGTDSSTWGREIRSLSKPLANTTYWFRVVWDGTTIYFYLKTSKDAEWELQGTTQQSYVEFSQPMMIGCDDDTGDNTGYGKIWAGSINLSQSYIKINGEMWWQGNDLGFNQFRVKEGLKTLIPNGRNENRTLKNIENNVSEDLIYTFEDNNTGSYWAAVGENAARLNKKSWEYNNVENYIIGTLEDDNYGNLGVKALATMIGDVEVKNGNIISFVPYNPVQLAKEQDIDGMWTTANYNIFKNVSFSAQENKTYDLSTYLPNDGNIYEVIFDGLVTTGANSGDTAYLILSTSLIINCTVISTQTTAARTVLAASSLTLPVGADRRVVVKNGSANDTATFRLDINAYRKVR